MGDKGFILAFKGSDDCIDGQGFFFMKLKEIHRKLAILPLNRESRVLGPQRPGGRQRVNFLHFSGRMTVASVQIVEF